MWVSFDMCGEPQVHTTALEADKSALKRDIVDTRAKYDAQVTFDLLRHKSFMCVIQSFVRVT